MVWGVACGARPRAGQAVWLWGHVWLEAGKTEVRELKRIFLSDQISIKKMCLVGAMDLRNYMMIK